jgi:hypothetical protein
MAEDQIQARRKKRDALRAAALSPYPDRCKRTHALVAANALAGTIARCPACGASRAV